MKLRDIDGSVRDDCREQASMVGLERTPCLLVWWEEVEEAAAVAENARRDVIVTAAH